MKYNLKQVVNQYRQENPGEEINVPLIKKIIEYPHHLEDPLTIEHISLYHWLYQNHPESAIRIDAAITWHEQLANSTLYKKTEYRFPVELNYPFSLISLKTFVDERFELRISSSTFLSAPILHKAFRDYAYFSTEVDGVLFSNSNIRFRINPNSIMLMVNLFFSIIEKQLLPNQTESDFYRQVKVNVVQATKEYIIDSANQFPAPKYLQRQPAEQCPNIRGYSIPAVYRLLQGVPHFIRDSLQGPLDANMFVFGYTMLSYFISETLNTKIESSRFQSILDCTKALLEFGADPTRLSQSDLELAPRTTLETLIICANKTGVINQKIIEDLIMLLLHFDNDRSHLIVATEYADHFIGKALIAGKKALAQSKTIPPRIKDLYPYNKKLVAINEANEFVFIKSTTLKEFFLKAGRFDNERRQAAQLYYDVFSKLVTLNPESIEHDLEELIISPGSKSNPAEFGYIDLVLDKDYKVIGYSASLVMIPDDQTQPILHVLPLAVCTKFVSDQFKRLMSLLSFWRTFQLRDHYHRQVLTSYNAVSASSYLQIAQLHACPKYADVVTNKDLNLLINTLYDLDSEGENHLVKQGVHYFKSHLFYSQPPNAKQGQLTNIANINCEAFNKYIAMPQYEVLIAFYLTSFNEKMLSFMLSSPLIPQLPLEQVFDLLAHLERPPRPQLLSGVSNALPLDAPIPSLNPGNVT